MLKSVLDEGMKIKIGGKKKKNNGVGGGDHDGGGGAGGGKYVELEEQQPHDDVLGANDPDAAQHTLTKKETPTAALPVTEEEKLVRLIIYKHNTKHIKRNH